MRVIAGTARSIPLDAPEGKNTRPTTDKIKETLFNLLQFELNGCSFADLFAGSGAIGIEALSRGADRAVFSDIGREAVACIGKNLSRCHLEDRAAVIRGDALAGLRAVQRTFPPDSHRIFFLDPPYGAGLEFPVLRKLIAADLVDGDSTVIVETALDADPAELEACGYVTERVKEYKNQKHIFLRKA